MDVSEIIKGLRVEQVRLDNVVCALETLAVNHPKRGRPPKWAVSGKA